MRFAVVDDDREQLQELCAMLHAALADMGIRADHLHSYSSGEELLSVWQPGNYDIIILDIYMDDISGVELARKIRESDARAALVFCSSSNDFASESYEVNARYYLQKPVTAEKLNAMLQRLDLNRLEQTRSIQLPDGYQLLIRSLVYTNYINHAVTFYIQDALPHSIYIAQAEVERLLSAPCFYAANKGNIVNFHMVQKVTSDSFIMNDGATVPIARRRYKEAKEAFARFHFQQLSEEAVW